MTALKVINQAGPVLKLIDADGPVLKLVCTNGATVKISEVGLRGPAGGDENSKSMSFSFGDATPAPIHTLPAGKAVIRCVLDIENAFNGAAPAISIGTMASPEAIMPVIANLPAEAGQYETNPAVKFLVPTALTLFIDPGAGASSGSGSVYLELF